MFIEALIGSACYWGNGDACTKSSDAYFKYYKYDKQVEELGENARKKYPAIYYTVTVLGATATQRHYNGVIYKGFGADIDISNPNNEKGILFWRYHF